MLRDTHKILGNAELSVTANHSILVLLKFIDSNISGFRNYYFSVPDPSVGENAITFHITNYFNACLYDMEDGFIPYKFSFIKNPAQSDSGRETDLGVVILNKSTATYPIIEFEAKRLSDSSHNNEYVYGDRGGIERFKRRHHGPHLRICGMFGYIQSASAPIWLLKINGWITDRANCADGLDWKNPNELLEHQVAFIDVNKYCSISTRIDQSSITLYHYLIDLIQLEK